MRTAELGRTGLVVSRVGLGLAALGRPGYINLGHAEDLGADYDVAAMEDRAHAVLDTAWAEGIRYFDAARSYGDGERFLGTWLASRGIPPEAVVVGSKWGYTYTAGWQVRADRHEVKDALANGRLTDRNRDPAFTPQRRLLRETAARLGAGLDALALAAVLAQPWADVVLSGAATPEHLRSNLAALPVPWDAEAGDSL